MQKEEFSFTYAKVLEFDSHVWGNILNLMAKQLKLIFQEQFIAQDLNSFIEFKKTCTIRCDFEHYYHKLV